jgi:hypothetical protein
MHTEIRCYDNKERAKDASNSILEVLKILDGRAEAWKSIKVESQS